MDVFFVDVRRVNFDDFSLMAWNHFSSGSGLTDRWLGQVIVYEVG